MLSGPHDNPTPMTERTRPVPAPLSPNADARREAPLAMDPDEFRAVGHRLVDRIADALSGIGERPVTPGESPRAVRGAVEAVAGVGLPAEGASAGRLLDEAAALLLEHSLWNGHPRFWGYITSSAAPIGALGDLLAAAVNPNVGSFVLSPAATEIEAQTIRWIAELLGFPTTCGGILVSGGNMANFVGVLAARRARLPWDVRERGLHAGAKPVLYTSRDTHTWIQKAADLFGFGLDAIRWIETDARHRMDVRALERAVREDRAAGGRLPLLVVGTAGSVGIGAVDPLPDVAAVAREHGLWFHVDGAYGAVAAALPEASPELKGLAEADSVAVDPHKWLYAPLEAGCALVRDPRHLADAFSFHPEYYNFGGGDGDEAPRNFYELGMQNSRGFRALKVWLGLRQAGRTGVARMIREDVALARVLFDAAAAHPELEARTCELSIATFRYVPADLRGTRDEAARSHLDRLNRALLDRLQSGGEAFVSNAIVDGEFVLRACIVNFRTTEADVRALPGIVARVGGEIDRELRG